MMLRTGLQRATEATRAQAAMRLSPRLTVAAVRTKSNYPTDFHKDFQGTPTNHDELVDSVLEGGLEGFGHLYEFTQLRPVETIAKTKIRSSMHLGFFWYAGCLASVALCVGKYIRMCLLGSMCLPDHNLP